MIRNAFTHLVWRRVGIPAFTPAVLFELPPCVVSYDPSIHLCLQNFFYEHGFREIQMIHWCGMHVWYDDERRKVKSEQRGEKNSSVTVSKLGLRFRCVVTIRLDYVKYIVPWLIPPSWKTARRFPELIRPSQLKICLNQHLVWPQSVSWQFLCVSFLPCSQHLK